jgi:tetratricopeptide (TPR) repeat protein
MPTAIEMYRKAYELDYRKGDWQQAEGLYREIIEKFPYSDEKEYALVHLERLEKLKANPRDQALQPVRASSQQINNFNILNFFLILILAVAIAGTGYVIWIQGQHQKYTSLLLQGLLSEKIGNYPQASDLYKQAEAMLPGEPDAYHFLAESYLDRKQYSLADIESKKWEIADPGNRAITEFRMRVKSTEDASMRGGKQ